MTPRIDPERTAYNVLNRLLGDRGRAKGLIEKLRSAGLAPDPLVWLEAARDELASELGEGRRESAFPWNAPEVLTEPPALRSLIRPDGRMDAEASDREIKERLRPEHRLVVELTLVERLPLAGVAGWLGLGEPILIAFLGQVLDGLGEIQGLDHRPDCPHPTTVLLEEIRRHATPILAGTGAGIGGTGTGTPDIGTGTPGIGAGIGTGTPGIGAGIGTGTPGIGTGTGTQQGSDPDPAPCSGCRTARERCRALLEILAHDSRVLSLGSPDLIGRALRAPPVSTASRGPGSGGVPSGGGVSARARAGDRTPPGWSPSAPAAGDAIPGRGRGRLVGAGLAAVAIGALALGTGTPGPVAREGPGRPPVGLLALEGQPARELAPDQLLELEHGTAALEYFGGMSVRIRPPARARPGEETLALDRGGALLELAWHRDPGFAVILPAGRLTMHEGRCQILVEGDGSSLVDVLEGHSTWTGSGRSRTLQAGDRIRSPVPGSPVPPVDR